MSTNSNQVEVGNLPKGAIVIAHTAGSPLVIKILPDQTQDMRRVDVSRTVSYASEVRTSTFRGCTVGKEVVLCTDKATTLYLRRGNGSVMPIHGVRLDRVLYPGDDDYQKADELFALPGAARDLLNEQPAHTA